MPIFKYDWAILPFVIIRASSNLQVSMGGIRSCMSLNIGQVGILGSEGLALERRKLFSYTYNGNNVVLAVTGHNFDPNVYFMKSRSS